MAGLVKDVFESAAGQDAVGAVSDYLRTQRVTSLPDLQVHHPTTYHNTQTCVAAIIVSVVAIQVSVVLQRSHRYAQAVASTQYHGSILLLSFVFVPLSLSTGCVCLLCQLPC